LKNDRFVKLFVVPAVNPKLHPRYVECLYDFCFSAQYAIFEPGTRNTGTAIAGKNIANPVAMLNAAVDMLEHLGHHYHADMIQKAINRTINEDRIHTPGILG
jgi:isocitrate/isopropylmalate dehydrogenase